MYGKKTHLDGFTLALVLIGLVCISCSGYLAHETWFDLLWTIVSTLGITGGLWFIWLAFKGG